MRNSLDSSNPQLPPIAKTYSSGYTPIPKLQEYPDEFTALLNHHNIKHESSLPEISFKSVFLVIILSVILGAANAYLGLFAGITFSVSIPSAILAMALLRPFKSNILEINAVQTGSAAGSSLASGIIYTIPALIMLGYWEEIHYLETTLIAGVGGILGVMFSVPLRRVLIVENPLTFPEGVATAEVIKVAHVTRHKKNKVGLIIFGAILGAISKLGQSGLMLWDDSFERCWYVYGIIIYVGCNLSPSLVAVGYIVKLKIAVLLLLGGILNWWIAIPVISYIQADNYNPNNNQPVLIAGEIWSLQSRYIGVGAMLLGGFGALISLARPLIRGIKSSFQTYRVIREHGIQAISRTERDIPVPVIVFSVLLLIIPMAILYSFVIGNVGLGIFMAILLLFCGFLFSAVGAYMAGIVGSSNNPISGITLTTMIVSSAVLLGFLGMRNPLGPPAAIMIGAVVCCAASIAGDNMQDLKAGHIVGSTPIVLQVMQLIGVVAPVFTLAPIIKLLIDAYGIGDVTPGHPTPLPAPQASLMRAVTYSIFYEKVPWDLVGIGMGLAAIVMFIDLVASQSKQGLRVPVLSVALGLYLPLELSFPIFFGGFVAWLGTKTLQRAECSDRKVKLNWNNGLLYASGLITGEALVGIAMAIPIVVTGRVDVLAIWGAQNVQWPGAIIIGLVMILLYFIVVKHRVLQVNINNSDR